MSVFVPVERQKVTVADDGSMTCSCGRPPFCSHIEAVASGDAMLPPGPLAKALKLIDPNLRLQVLTKRLDEEKDGQKRDVLEAGIARLRIQLGR